MGMFQARRLGMKNPQIQKWNPWMEGAENTLRVFSFQNRLAEYERINH